MQKGKPKKGKEDGAKAITPTPAGKADDSAARHWDAWVVSDKFTLRDWYYLDQEESEDLHLLSLSEHTIDNLLENCLSVYIKKNVIAYTLDRFQQDILQYMLLIQHYPESLRNNAEITYYRNEFDKIEPLPSTIDAYSCGWPIPIFDPFFNETKLKSKHVAEESGHNLPVVPTVPEESRESREIARRSDMESPSHFFLPERKLPSKKEVPSVIAVTSRKRKTTAAPLVKKSVVASRKKRISKKTEMQTPDDFAMEASATEIEATYSHEPSVSSDIPIRTSQSMIGVRFNMDRSESNSDVDSMKSQSVMYTPPKAVPTRSNATKVRLTGRDTKLSIPANLVFDHLEPSNFLPNRTKTGYVIKDLEVPKDLAKTPLTKRIAGIPKRGSEVTAKSTIVAELTSGNVLTMPSVVDKMTNLGGGVLARKDPKPNTSDQSPQDREDLRPLLNPISRSKVEPRLLISQLIDRSLPGVGHQTKVTRN